MLFRSPTPPSTHHGRVDHGSDQVRPGGALLVDGFVTDSDEMAQAPKLLRDWGFARRGNGGTHYYDAPM